MSAITPGLPSSTATLLWERVTARAATMDGASFRDGCLRVTVDGILAKLAAQDGLEAFARDAEADEDTYGWGGARHQARKLGRDDDAFIATLMLISEKTTSGEGASAYSRALSVAAARVLGGEPVPALMGRAAQLHQDHVSLFERLIVIQRDLTRDLLVDLPLATLHRGDVLTSVPAAGHGNSSLWPVSSFATNFDSAAEFACKKAMRCGGTPIVYSAQVSNDRLLATPATGAAAADEFEVVVGVGHPHDDATITAV